MISWNDENAVPRPIVVVLHDDGIAAVIQPEIETTVGRDRIRRRQHSLRRRPVPRCKLTSTLDAVTEVDHRREAIRVERDERTRDVAATVRNNRFRDVDRYRPRSRRAAAKRVLRHVGHVAA